MELNNEPLSFQPEGHVLSEKEKKKRKERKKQKKIKKQGSKATGAIKPKVKPKQEYLDPAEVEYVISNPFESDELQFDPTLIQEYKSIFNALAPHVESTKNAEEPAPPKKPKISKRDRKRQKRIPFEVLKSLVERPELVEPEDVCSENPIFLLYLKSFKNTIPVPRHWSSKKGFMQGKFEKPRFALPRFIKDTKIAEIREANIRQDAAKRAKQKTFDRLKPSMSRMEIDYDTLYDAFFKFQTKPTLSGYGEVYYEGQEKERALFDKNRPGFLSDELKRALGMTHNSPPPWLFNMQRVGPPPSYPHLRIQGLNAPLPPGAQYGFHAGGWGQCPLDANGNPKYPDAVKPPNLVEDVAERAIEHWGSLASFMESNYSSSSEEEHVELEKTTTQDSQQNEATHPPKERPTTKRAKNALLEEIRSEPTFSIAEGGTNADSLLRKKKKKHGQLGLSYTVLEQEPSTIKESDLFGSVHTYKINNGGVGVVDLMKSQKTAPVELVIDPSDIGNVDAQFLKEKYEQIVQKEKEDKKENESKKKGDKRKRAASTRDKTKVEPAKKKKKNDFENNFKF